MHILFAFSFHLDRFWGWWLPSWNQVGTKWHQNPTKQPIQIMRQHNRRSAISIAADVLGPTRSAARYGVSCDNTITEVCSTAAARSRRKTATHAHVCGKILSTCAARPVQPMRMQLVERSCDIQQMHGLGIQTYTSHMKACGFEALGQDCS